MIDTSNMLEQPPPGMPEMNSPSGLTPHPKKTWKIWFSALLPLIDILVFLVVVFVLESSSSNVMDSVLNFSIFLHSIICLFCWGMFAVAISERLQGPTKVILIILYPVIQVCVQFAVFFGGCLALYGLM
ncbi:MAG: hypothetical protein ACPG32_08405 [Akkermansiaceae bacterium]